MKYSNMINGYTSLNLTKLDILDQLKEIKVATKYLLDGKEVEGFPGMYASLNYAENACLLVSALQLISTNSPRSRLYTKPCPVGIPTSPTAGLSKSCLKTARNTSGLSKTTWVSRFRQVLMFVVDVERQSLTISPRLQWIGVGPARDSTIKLF
jgi:hypothetical protein